MAIHNIERCRDGCRTSLLIARVVLTCFISWSLKDLLLNYSMIMFFFRVYISHVGPE